MDSMRSLGVATRSVIPLRRSFRQMSNLMQEFGIHARNAGLALGEATPFLMPNRAKSRALRGTFPPVPIKPSAKRRYGR